LATRIREYIDLCAAHYFDPELLQEPGFAAHADAEFNGLAIMLFTLQFQSNAAYRRICEARGIQPDTVIHWSDIPCVPTEAFKELDLSSIPPEGRTHEFHSSGTTQQKRSRHLHHADSLALYEHSAWTWFKQRALCGNVDFRLLFLTPPATQSPNSSLVHMFDLVRREMGQGTETFLGSATDDGAWTVSLDALSTAMRDEADRPIFLLGTAFSFVHLLDELGKRGVRLRLPPDSRVLETGGYKGRSRTLPRTELHELIAARLGIGPANTRCEYGMSELSSQAYDDEKGLFQFPPWARVRVVSPETGQEVRDGEVGLLRVLDLANVFSVMAVQTADLAIRRGEGFELLGRSSNAEPRGCSLMVED